MNIKIKNLSLLNFKGVKKLEINDIPDVLNIRGANATFKTTIADGCYWLFFGKNAEDKSNFNIKTLDEKGNPVHHLNHEVAATLDIDGMETTFRRVYKEDWVTTRGEETPNLKGHVTEYFVNLVPLNQSEYKAKVDSLMPEAKAKGIEPEELFRIITNPLYFNSLKWETRRAILFGMTNDIPDSQIAATNPEFQKLMADLTGKSLEEFKKQLASQRLLLKKQLDEIPSRIDEINRNMPELKDPIEIQKQIDDLTAKIDDIDTLLNDSSLRNEKANKTNQEKKNLISDLHYQLTRIEKEEQNKVADSSQDNKSYIDIKQKEFTRLAGRLETENENVTDATRIIKELNEKRETLLTRWHAKNNSVLEISDSDSPNCALGFPKCQSLIESGEADQKKSIKEFNESKVIALQFIQTEGEEVARKLILKKKFLEQTKIDIVEIQKDFEKAKAELEKAKVSVPAETKPVDCTTLPKYIATKAQIATLESELTQVIVPDNSAYMEEKRQKNADLDVLKKQLSVKDTIDQNKSRITELLEQEKSYAQQIAALEKKQFVITNFEKAKVDAIEANINKMFPEDLEFRMFKQQINGGWDAVCDTMYKGVPFPDVNNAGKIWAGIDIINTICEFHEVWAVIIADNRESVTNIPETKAQVISLIVDENCKELCFT